MHHSFARTVVALAVSLFLAGLFLAAAQDRNPAWPGQGAKPGAPSSPSGKPAPAADDGLKFVGQIVGETTSVAGSAGHYERVLLAPPDDGRLKAGNTWEIGMDVAVKLGLKKPAERWAVIRRNLLLSPSDREDLVLWTEVVDSLLDQIGKLPAEEKPGVPGFGLLVAFPGQAASDDAKANVALTFNSNQTSRKDKEQKKDFESELSRSVREPLTGAEGFLNIVDDQGVSLTSDEAQNALLNVKLKLYDGGGREVDAVPEMKGRYFRFSPLTADGEFGSDYWLKVQWSAEAAAQKGVAGKVLSEHYVPVRQGARTRMDVRLALSKIVQAGKGDIGLPGAPAAVSLLYQNFVASNPLLGVLTQVMPSNPGLHLGVLQIKDAGPQVFWSTRFRLLADMQDRSPRFITRGSLRLQCMTEAATDGQPSWHYVKITWCGSVDEDQLSLKSRRNAKFLGLKRDFLGIGLGVVPSLEPSLFAVGASLKPIKGCEIFLGAGIRQDYPTRFVYGLTLDVMDMLSFLGIASPSETPAAATAVAAESSGAAEKATGQRFGPAPPRKKSN
ncbi:MAG: hypothetical protein NTZ26_08400 [Candidatus Aminicenantes bacterium]|nr:hypothetical protein [Candidatus Aminicenantes bacterium]